MAGCGCSTCPVPARTCANSACRFASGGESRTASRGCASASVCRPDCAKAVASRARVNAGGYLRLNDGSRVRLRPEHPNHVWSCGFATTFRHDGNTARMLDLIDGYTRACWLNAGVFTTTPKDRSMGRERQCPFIAGCMQAVPGAVLRLPVPEQPEIGS